MYRLLNPLSFAAGQLAVFQGGAKCPYLCHTVERATRKNSQLAAARRVALKMGRLLRCSSVTYRSRYAPLAPVRLGPPRRRPILNATKLKGFRRRCTRVAALDFVVDCSEKPDSFRSIKTTMSVTTSVKRYISSFSSRSVQNRISVAASASFSSSFVTSCRFWLAANSIWATLAVAACVTAGMRLRMINGWPFVAFVIVSLDRIGHSRTSQIETAT